MLNDKPVGTTPYSEEFLWYGWYRVSLTKDGYERFDDRVLIEAPIYFWIPFDLIMELLPIKIQDAREFSYQLVTRKPLSGPVPPAVPRSFTAPDATQPEATHDDESR